MKKTFLGAIPVVYDQPTGGDVVTDYGTGSGASAGGGLYDTSGAGTGTGTGTGTNATNELPGGGPGMQTETGEPPKPFDEGTPTDDKQKTNFLPWIIGGIVLFMLFRRK